MPLGTCVEVVTAIGCAGPLTPGSAIVPENPPMAGKVGEDAVDAGVTLDEEEVTTQFGAVPVMPFGQEGVMPPPGLWKNQTRLRRMRQERKEQSAQNRAKVKEDLALVSSGKVWQFAEGARSLHSGWRTPRRPAFLVNGALAGRPGGVHDRLRVLEDFIDRAAIARVRDFVDVLYGVVIRDCCIVSIAVPKTEVRMRIVCIGEKLGNDLRVEMARRFGSRHAIQRPVRRAVGIQFQAVGMFVMAELDCRGRSRKDGRRVGPASGSSAARMRIVQNERGRQA